MAIWFSMAFQAGAINAGGFLSCHRFVTHTTGFATHFGAEFAAGEYRSAFGMLSVPIYFLAGATLSAFFIDKKMTEGKNPQYTTVISFIAVLLFIATLCGDKKLFGIFGAPLELSQDYFLLALLSLASGLQNAAITSASGAVVRTTHLTGITTDLGIGLARVFAKKTNNMRVEFGSQEMKANYARIGLIVFFILGSTVASYLFYNVGYWGFLLPAGISTSLVVLGLYLKFKDKERSPT